MNVGTILLTDVEIDLLAQIDNAVSNGRPYDGSAALALMQSLIVREAIPEVRVQYFRDPSFKIGGTSTSYEGGFERNGVRGEDIFRHPSFVSYLRYFIHGAKLPARIKKRFALCVEECGDYPTSGDYSKLWFEAKRLARAVDGSSREKAEEFYKLALDIGLDQEDARGVRDAVLTARR